ncbi:hypothetical protein JW960_21840 [candidate division KSB1 bacterium]|nr:hypothetical protein [candidate division KSB1 bacterium]
MEETEVIIVNGIDTPTYDAIIRQAIEYAIISIPFTFNRMEIDDLQQKIFNIAKGKVAEGLFLQFCQMNDIPVDSQSCTTPFYQADHRDFVLMNWEWDIKNNYLYHPGQILEKYAYVDLPALVPNRGEWDQWGKRDRKFQASTKGAGFIFTFLKNQDRYRKGQTYFSIHLSTDQHALLHKLYNRYKGKHQDKEPFAPLKFWQRFLESSPHHKLNFSVSERPWLIICGCAIHKHWELFTDSGAGRHLYPSEEPATLITTINNRTCPIGKLPSFASIFPDLRDGMKGAFFKSTTVSEN